MQGVAHQLANVIEVDAESLAGDPVSDADVAYVWVVGAADRVVTGVVALYRLDEAGGTTVADTSGFGLPFDLTLADPANASWLPGGGLSVETPTVITQASPVTKVIDALQTSQAVTLEAWARPANVTQFGPARIAALSEDPFPTGGNFVLGQASDTWVTRLRTSETDVFGKPDMGPTSGSAITGVLAHLVYTRSPGGAEAFYVDGVQVATGTRTGTFANWGSSFELALLNEPTVDRAWLGSLYLFAIYDRAIDSGEVSTNFVAGPHVMLTESPSALIPSLQGYGLLALGGALLVAAIGTLRSRAHRQASR
jgi:hypothetical protein